MINRLHQNSINTVPVQNIIVVVVVAGKCVIKFTVDYCHIKSIECHLHIRKEHNFFHQTKFLEKDFFF